MEPGPCVVCSSTESTRRCSRCLLVFYCGRAHQKKDWPAHRTKCLPFEVKQNETLGRYLVATHDIVSGQVVLREVPLLKGPAAETQPVCLGCCVTLAEERTVGCARCGWPMCTAACAGSADHRAECAYLAKKRIKKVTPGAAGEAAAPVFRCVTALRALLLRESDPARWRKLWSLESHCALRRATPHYEQQRAAVARFMRRSFKLAAFTEEDILRVWGILQVNGFVVPLSKHKNMAKLPHYLSLYEWGSLLEHECRSNCCYSITGGGELVVRAVKGIAPGDHLSISYIDPLQLTTMRRQELLETRFFWCRCSRCLDPTEVGSYFSGLRCARTGCPGMLLPTRKWLQVQPSDDQMVTPWRCNRCQRAVSPNEVLRRMGVARGDIQLTDDGNDDSNTPERCLEYLRRQEEADIVSRNNYLLTMTRIRLASKLGETTTESIADLTDQKLLMKEQLLRDVIRLTCALCPAETRLLGRLLYSLHLTVFEVAHRHISKGQVDMVNIKRLLQDDLNVVMEAVDVLQFEPACYVEGLMLDQLRKFLESIDRDTAT